MSDADFHNRIRELYRMLFELATGNLSFRLPTDDRGDDLSRLLQSLGTFAAQFQLAIRKSGYVVPFYSYQNLTQLIFVLDKDHALLAFSSQVTKLLSHNTDELFGAGFEALLTEEAKALWRTAVQRISSDEYYHETIHLHFISSTGKTMAAFCTVSRLLYSETIFVSSITTQLIDTAYLNLSAISSEKTSDAAVFQNLYEFILLNLDKPLPTLKELSVLFQTNEFRLKDGFRRYFNTSIYQLYNDERLKRAYHLIQETDFSLKSVAIMCGFKDYVTFSKAFKKKYGTAPGNVIRSNDL